MDNQQGPTVSHRELCSMLCGSLDEKGVWRRMDAHICVAELLCCSPKATITVLIGYTPIRNKLMSLKERKKKQQNTLATGRACWGSVSSNRVERQILQPQEEALLRPLKRRCLHLFIRSFMHPFVLLSIHSFVQQPFVYYCMPDVHRHRGYSLGSRRANELNDQPPFRQPPPARG